MKRALIFLAIMAATHARAQWPGDWQGGHFEGRERAWHCYSGLLERAQAAGVSTNALTPPHFFTQRTRLVAYKSFIANTLAPAYVNTDLTNAAGEYFRTNEYSPLMMTASSVCSIASLPTNFFSYTPFFQLGSDTNYGWFPMRRAINALVWTQRDGDNEDADTSRTNFYTYKSNGGDSLGTGSSDCNAMYERTQAQWTNGWLAVTSPAASSTRKVPIYTLKASASTNVVAPINYFSHTRHSAQLQTFPQDPIYTGCAHSAWVLAYCKKSDLDADDSTNSIFWDGDGLGLIEDALQVFVDMAPAATNHRIMAESDMPAGAAVTNEFFDSPLAIADFDCGNVGTNTTYGISTMRPGGINPSEWWIFRWNVANGFRYVP
jgi:hypothetical protein